MYEMDLVTWINIKSQYILCTFRVILWFEMEKLFMVQLEMVKLFVQQLVHEFLLFDRNSMFCIQYEILIRFLIICKEHILKK
jgi:hypothetical protein